MKIYLHRIESLVYSSELEEKCLFSISGKSLFAHTVGVSSYYEIEEEKQEQDKSIQLLKGRLAKEFICKLAIISKSLSLRKVQLQQFNTETRKVYKMLEKELFRKFVLEFQLKRKCLLLKQQAILGKEETCDLEMSL